MGCGSVATVSGRGAVATVLAGGVATFFIITIHRVSEIVCVQLFGGLGPGHRRICGLLGVERLLVRDVGVGVDGLGLGVVQRVHDHMVVQDLGFVHGVDGVELVLELGLVVCPLLLQLAPLLHAHDDDSGYDDNDGNQCTERSYERSVPRAIPAGRNTLELVVLRVDGTVGQDLAVGSSVPWQAAAGERVVAVDAEAAVQAGIIVTLVDFQGTILARVSRCA